MIAIVSRQRALNGLQHILKKLGASDQLLRVSRWKEPLQGYPPPGSDEIVMSRSADPPTIARHERTGPIEMKEQWLRFCYAVMWVCIHHPLRLRHPSTICRTYPSEMRCAVAIANFTGNSGAGRGHRDIIFSHCL